MNKKILDIALPNIVSNITIPLLGIVDLALMGHLGEVDFIGGIALGGIIFNFLYWGFAFLRMGTSGITAQAYGARNLNESILSLGRALLVAAIGSILILLLQKPIALLSFSYIDSETSVENIALSYYNIRIWAAPATISLYALTGWFIGMQNSKIPMIIAIICNIINISLSAYFVYGLNLDARGVALGTVIAQYCGLVLASIFIWRYYRRLFKYWTNKGLLKIKELKHFVLINKDIFIRTLCIPFAAIPFHIFIPNGWICLCCRSFSWKICWSSKSQKLPYYCSLLIYLGNCNQFNFHCILCIGREMDIIYAN